MTPFPLDLLEITLDTLESNLIKSTRLFENGRLEEEEHKIHKKNLIPRITKYKEAIEALKKVYNDPD